MLRQGFQLIRKQVQQRAAQKCNQIYFTAVSLRFLHCFNDMNAQSPQHTCRKHKNCYLAEFVLKHIVPHLGRLQLRVEPCSNHWHNLVYRLPPGRCRRKEKAEIGSKRKVHWHEVFHWNCNHFHYRTGAGVLRCWNLVFNPSYRTLSVVICHTGIKVRLILSWCQTALQWRFPKEYISWRTCVQPSLRFQVNLRQDRTVSKSGMNKGWTRAWLKRRTHNRGATNKKS